VLNVRRQNFVASRESVYPRASLNAAVAATHRHFFGSFETILQLFADVLASCLATPR
jgi:hypothetical protein